MALTLNATPGDATANSYATVAEAQAIVDYRVGSASTTAWAALSADQKIQALVTATRYIDTIGEDFIGDRTDPATQALEWPRSGTDFDDDELPATLVDATIELALSFTTGMAAGTVDVLALDATAANVKRKKVGPLETEYFKPGAGADPQPDTLARFPTVVQLLLDPLVDDEPEANVYGVGTNVVTRGS